MICAPMILQIRTLPILFILSLCVPSFAEDAPAKKEPEKKPKAEAPKEPVSREGKVTIGGESIPYTATTGKMQLFDDKGKPRASIFYVSYTRNLVKDTKQRPVMFAFNGGPGSSAVWLHLGILGPRRIDIPGDGTAPIQPPARLIDNEFSILDACDLVFIDPVSTGYSRAEEGANPKDFHGLESDIESVGDFIRAWVTENKRWGSPKYLCGESYGGIRAAGLSAFLQNRYGMSLNGVVLLSSLLDFRTLMGSQGSQLSYQIFLPTFATVAHFHGKVKGDRAELLAEAKEFAFDEYAIALLKGSDLGADEKAGIAARLAELTGIPAETWMVKELRMDSSEFRSELLKAEGKVLGRFDARVAWDSTDPESRGAEYDPSYSLAIGAFSTAMLTYLGDELGWDEDQPYEVLTGVGPWRYGSENQIVNVTRRLTQAIRDNPKLRVLVMGAHADLATPPEGVPYSLRQEVDLPESLRKQISFVEYDAGHMFYLNPPDLEKSRKDLIDFLSAGKP